MLKFAKILLIYFAFYFEGISTFVVTDLTTSSVAQYLAKVSDCKVVSNIQSLNEFIVPYSLQYLPYFHMTSNNYDINISGLSAGKIVSIFPDKTSGKTYLNIRFDLLIESGVKDISVHTFDEPDVLVKLSYLKRYYDVDVTVIFKGVDSIDRETYEVIPYIGYVEFDESDTPGLCEAAQKSPIIKARAEQIFANKDIVAAEEGYYIGKLAGQIFVDNGLCVPNTFK